jgi:3-keto-L-gulonate-6-phosphate decarboxylase
MVAEKSIFNDSFNFKVKALIIEMGTQFCLPDSSKSVQNVKQKQEKTFVTNAFEKCCQLLDTFLPTAIMEAADNILTICFHFKWVSREIVF